METHNILFALGLTLFAGLSTGIGSAMSLVSKKFSPKFLAISLGFSAGVMIYVSLVDIFQKAKVALVESFGEKQGYVFTVLAFFGGIALIAIIDKLIPSYENPHELKNLKSPEDQKDKTKSLMRMGMFSALAIAIHNFPEGLATFMAAMVIQPWG